MRRDLPTGTLTLLFTDVEGSTRLLKELGEEAYARALAEHRRRLREAFARHGGVEVDTQGDAFFYVFQSAPEALAAAAEAREALAGGPIRVRMGLHTGCPRLAEEGYVGEDVHKASRIAAAAHGGQVVLSRETRALLDDALPLTDLGEHRLKDFEAPVWLYQLGPERFPPLKTISNTNLPRPASSLVGRQREVAEVVNLLREARLLTLTGPGGTGKTRLAIEAASELVPEFRNGVFWVGLAPLRDPALVPEAIAHTLGSRDGLAQFIGEREMLLLLDNFEQVVEAAPELPSLLEACPHLKILVTSRELLRVRGEVEYPVPPLAEAEAVELFCARSRVDPDPTVAELCRRLDHLPLAVELAAARSNLLSPAQILGRLSARLDLFTGGRDADPRQRTLRATIEWSHDLLTPQEQRLFARLSVFRGGCTLEAAQAVAGADLEGLQSLLDKSLLRRREDRFFMLETIREYAAERLEGDEEREHVRRRFAQHLLELAEAARPHLRRPEQQVWFRRLGSEQDNLRAVLGWAIEHGRAEVGLRLATALQVFWRRRGQHEEASRWLESLLALGPALPPRIRAPALAAAAHFAALTGNLGLAEQRFAESIPALRRLGDEAGLAEALRGAAELAAEQGDDEGARQAAEEALELFAKLGDLGAVAGRLRMLGELALGRGDVASARRLFERAIATSREAGDEGNVARLTHSLADLELAAGHLAEAERLYRSALRSSEQRQDRIAYSLLGLAAVAARHGEPDKAGQLWGAGQALAERLGMRIDPEARARYERALGDLDDRSRSCFEAGLTRGAGLSLADVADELPPAPRSVTNEA